MLAKKDIEYVHDHFGVYDHDWRWYANFLGEPYFIGDTIVYFDGMTIYACAFSLRNLKLETPIERICHLLSSNAVFQGAKGIDIWGRFLEPPEEIQIADQTFQQHSFVDYQVDNHDVAVCIGDFSYEKLRKARLAKNAVRNKAIVTRIVSRHFFSYRHIELLDYWFKTHDISFPHTAFALSIFSFAKQKDVFLIESYAGNLLKGFAILSIPSRLRAVITQAFFENEPGQRYADSVMVEAIAYCVQNNIEYLHLGYSQTGALLEFKKKWGANWKSPPYREVFYTNSPLLGDHFSLGTYPWFLRILRNQFKKEW